MHQDYLKSLLKYDTETGNFIRVVGRGSQRVGKIAGAPHVKGYWRIGINGKFYLAHRLAFLYMNGYMPKQVDHINGDKRDNRWVNLRACSHAENLWNTRIPKDNSSGVKGVYYNKRDRAYVCRIYKNGELAWSHFTKCKREAEEKTKEARQRLHGSFTKHL